MKSCETKINLEPLWRTLLIIQVNAQLRGHLLSQTLCCLHVSWVPSRNATREACVASTVRQVQAIDKAKEQCNVAKACSSAAVIQVWAAVPMEGPPTWVTLVSTLISSSSQPNSDKVRHQETDVPKLKAALEASSLLFPSKKKKTPMPWHAFMSSLLSLTMQACLP